jgi:hypothetical protein
MGDNPGRYYTYRSRFSDLVVLTVCFCGFSLCLLSTRELGFAHHRTGFTGPRFSLFVTNLFSVASKRIFTQSRFSHTKLISPEEALSAGREHRDALNRDQVYWKRIFYRLVLTVRIERPRLTNKK